MARAVTESTLKNSKDELSAEKKNHKSLMKTFDEDNSLFQSKKSEVEVRSEAYQELQTKSKAAEKGVQLAQQHFQAVTAGLSSNSDGQEETLAAQKIGELTLTTMNSPYVSCRRGLPAELKSMILMVLPTNVFSHGIPQIP